MGLEPLHRQLLEPLALRVGGDGDDPLVAVQQLEHVVEDGFPVAVAADQVGLHELGRLLGESLRVAAGEDGDGAGVLALGPAEPLAALLVAEVGDGAAVHHKDVGLFALRHDGETGGAEHLFQRTGLVQIDLAAKGIKTNSHGVSFPQLINKINHPIIADFSRGEKSISGSFFLHRMQSDRHCGGGTRNGTEKFCGALRSGALLLAVCTGPWHGRRGRGPAGCHAPGRRGRQRRRGGSGGGIAGAAAAPQLDLNCRAAILIEQGSGRVLYEKNADERVPIASITKVMTLLLTFEAIHDGRLTMETLVPVSEHAYHMGGSQIWLEPGEHFTLDEMIKAICVSSANDAAVAVAELVGGSEPAFVEQMNARAAQLGMEQHVFPQRLRAGYGGPSLHGPGCGHHEPGPF